MLKKSVQEKMAKWMQHQTDADKRKLDELRDLKQAASKAYNSELRRQKSKYEQRERRARPSKQRCAECDCENGGKECTWIATD